MLPNISRGIFVIVNGLEILYPLRCMHINTPSVASVHPPEAVEFSCRFIVIVALVKSA
jgi:hypothetical protein